MVRKNNTTIIVIIIIALVIISFIYVNKKTTEFPNIPGQVPAQTIYNKYYYDTATNIEPLSCNVTQPSTTSMCVQTLNLCNSSHREDYISECTTCGVNSGPGPACGSKPKRCGPWILGGQPIKDSGVYMCSADKTKVMLRYCTQFSNTDTLVDDCADSLSCQYLGTPPAGTYPGTSPSVKCGGDYQKNIKLCEGNTFRSTSATGDLTSEDCSVKKYLCQATGCLDCKSGTSICGDLNGADSNRVYNCVNNKLVASPSTCPTNFYCTATGTKNFDMQASCTSTIALNSEQCAANTPQRWNGNAWVNKYSGACKTALVGSSSICSKLNPSDPMSPAECSDSCTNGQTLCDGTSTISSCVEDNNLGNIYVPVNGQIANSKCSIGTCKNTTSCNKQHLLGAYCDGKQIWNAVDAPTNIQGGKVSTSYSGTTCTNECNLTKDTEPTLAICTTNPNCPDGTSGQYVCKSGTTTLGQCSTDRMTFTETGTGLGDCRTILNNPSASCEVKAGNDACTIPTSQCEPNKYGCKNPGLTGVIYTCDQYGYFTTTIKSNCDNLGCNITGLANIATNSKCNNNCNPDTSRYCKSNVPAQCNPITDSAGFSYYKEVLGTACTNGCDTATGLCIGGCGGLSKVCSNGAMFNCVADQISGGAIYNCAQGTSGCSNDKSKCIDECSSFNQKTCTGSTAKVCGQNNYQFYWNSSDCGINGCEGTECKKYEANTFICYGHEIWSTDAQGKRSQLQETCSDTVFGWESYCVKGSKDCKYCTLNLDYCNANQMFKCTSETAPSRSVPVTCDVQCLSGSPVKCDNLKIQFVQGTFFKTDDVNIKYDLSGTVSFEPVQLDGIIIKLVSNSGNVTEVRPDRSSGTNGQVSAPFGLQPLGQYKAKIEFPGLLSKYNTENAVVVTDEYKITLKQGTTLIKVPNKILQIILEAKKSTGSAPQQVITSNVPTGLNVIDAGKTSTNQFKFNVEGDVGKYAIGFKAGDGASVNDQFEQLVNIELISPKLSIDAPIDKTISKGKKTWTVTVKAPTDPLGATSQIRPDAITAKVNGADNPLIELGSGRYDFTYTFSNAGTYAIVFDASLDGYESITKEYTTSLGVINPDIVPDDNRTITACKQWETYNGSTCSINWLLVIVLIVLAYFGFRIYKAYKKKRRR